MFQYWVGKFLADSLSRPLYTKLVWGDYLTSKNRPRIGFITDKSLTSTSAPTSYVTITTPASLDAVLRDYAINGPKANHKMLIINQYLEEAALVTAHADFVRDLYREVPPCLTTKRQIAVHVRLGDLATYFEQFVEAYIEFTKNVIERHPGLPVVIITDDERHILIQTVCDGLAPTNVRVQHQDWLSDYEDFGRSSVVVTTNSTFTWWAAWLSPCLEHKYVFLATAMEPVHNTDGLYRSGTPETWHVYEQSGEQWVTSQTENFQP